MQENNIYDTLNQPRDEFLAGDKAELPMMIGVIPFGMIYGILALSAGLPASAV
jgi:predicted branched-subunit amino acid permease